MTLNSWASRRAPFNAAFWACTQTMSSSLRLNGCVRRISIEFAMPHVLFEIQPPWPTRARHNVTGHIIHYPRDA